jgi:hypothetical protein
MAKPCFAKCEVMPQQRDRERASSKTYNECENCCVAFSMCLKQQQQQTLPVYSFERTDVDPSCSHLSLSLSPFSLSLSLSLSLSSAAETTAFKDLSFYLHH